MREWLSLLVDLAFNVLETLLRMTKESLLVERKGLKRNFPPVVIQYSLSQ